jgi:hypothetical protein
MELNDKVTQLEDEIKILKNEVQAVLLDLRESFLNNVNPFNPNPLSAPNRSAAVVLPLDEPVETIQENPDNRDGWEPEPENGTGQPAEDVNGETRPGGDAEDNSTPANGNGKTDILFDDTGAGYRPDSGNNNGAAVNGVNTARHSEDGITARFKTADSFTKNKTGLDLEAIDNLSGWVEESVTRLGPERTRTILDITETMGYLNAGLKNILVKFIHPVSDGEKITVTTQDYLSTLVQLNSLLGTDNRMEIALLFILILCQEYDNR